ncbi:serine hydrolase [Streptomyces sp. NPDC006923]|uniref:serine hydrolase n=1 Tax=Streptomyces sp. NPDC006923 TaxID=3155355 RepID=UPI0034087777
MSRHRLTPHARVSVRRRPALHTSAALTLLVAGWAVTAGLQGAAHSDSRAVPPMSVLPARSGEPSGIAPLASIVSLPAAPTASPSPSESVRALPAPKPERAPDEVLSERLKPLLGATSASVSVAILDLKDGRAARYGVGSGKTYDTASIVKVDILAALLLKAQDADRRLTAREKTYATAMIKVSDNASADALWDAIGGSGGLDAANRRLGLTGTTAGTNGLWGLTQTTAADQLVLLSAVFGEDSELSTASKTYARGLMGGIAADQDWGVSAAGSVTGLKNGWLQRSATGLWDINSIGRISVDGRPCLVAVLSRGSATMDAGVALVEKAAKAAASAVSGQA